MSGYRKIESEIASLVLPAGKLSAAQVEESQRRRLVLALAVEAHRTGYEVVSIDSVAEAAQLSKTSLYALYESREGLLQAAVEGFLASAGARIEAAASAEKQWGAAVRAGCEALLSAVADDPGPARLVFVEVPAVLQDGSDLALIERILSASAGAKGAPTAELEGLVRLATLGGVAAPIWNRLVRGKFDEFPGLASSLVYLIANAHFGPGEGLAIAG